MAVASTIAALAGAAATAASTGLALSKGGPKLPKLPPPLPPPTPPAPPAPPPPAPTETHVDEGLSKGRRKHQRRYGVADTMLTSPLGTSATSTSFTTSALGG